MQNPGIHLIRLLYHPIAVNCPSREWLTPSRDNHEGLGMAPGWLYKPSRGPLLVGLSLGAYVSVKNVTVADILVMDTMASYHRTVISVSVSIQTLWFRLVP